MPLDQQMTTAIETLLMHGSWRAKVELLSKLKLLGPTLPMAPSKALVEPLAMIYI